MAKKKLKKKTEGHSFQKFIGQIMEYAGIFLLVFHVILMVYYVYLKADIMIIANTFSILFYLILIIVKKNRLSLFSFSVFLEVMIHMVLAALTFGIEAGFQNWCFGLVCCFFLPTYSVNNTRRTAMSGSFAFAFMVAYFVLTFVVRVYDIRLMEPIDTFISNQLFLLNGTISFLTIIGFTTLYVTSSSKKYDQLVKIANYDELTALYNRHALNDITSSVARNAQISNKSYSVAIIDIDFFKKVNDTYGHAIGDEVLKELASIIRAESIKGITPGRWGGEEFVLIAPSSIYYNEFIIILEKLREKVAKTKIQVSNGKKLSVTISIGAYKIKDYKMSLEDAISLADDNLYEAKETGRNKVVS